MTGSSIGGGRKAEVGGRRSEVGQNLLIRRTVDLWLMRFSGRGRVAFDVGV